MFRFDADPSGQNLRSAPAKIAALPDEFGDARTIRHTLAFKAQALLATAREQRRRGRTAKPIQTHEICRA
jgi:hypothetical protein